MRSGTGSRRGARAATGAAVVVAALAVALAAGTAYVGARDEGAVRPAQASPTPSTPPAAAAPSTPATRCPPVAVLRRALADEVPTDVVRVEMCGSVYTGAVGDLDPPPEPLVADGDVAGLVGALADAPPARSYACSAVGGVEPYWLVLQRVDGTVATLRQDDCDGFALGDTVREGSLGTLFADAVQGQRDTSTLPGSLPPAPGCEHVRTGDVPQSLLGTPADLVAATLCVSTSPGAVPRLEDEVAVPADTLAVLLADLEAHGTDPADGFALDDTCPDAGVVAVDLVGVTAWGDRMTLTAPFCRTFYNHDVVWSPDDASHALLDDLIGPDAGR